ncbi:possible lyase [Plesiocystis pacifica SIR-1]|uniref:Possible lyase n=1 Tax=Plesiocystis pacifica SIR-1 TaxID=391625 RepID=A6GDR7_9BACT|nr:VOC family protein [Plesiocystis pacifica]EDM75956.1 possible lyase [Plesiocystis pacifica SIR-1]
MIKSLSHATIYVTDHDEALDFYTKKLGFEVRMDATMDGFRWVTVAPKDQPQLELVLMKLAPSPVMDEGTVAQMRELLSKGAFGTGVFATADCRGTHAELSAKGVEFIQPPTERPYGTEAVFKDPFGNWFSLTQHRQ